MDTDVVCMTAISSEMAPTRAFDYLVDLRNAVTWHPSICAALLHSGHAGLRGARYELTTAVGPLRLPTTIEVIELERPSRFAYEAETRLSHSHHQFCFQPRDSGVEIELRSTFTVVGLIRPLKALARPYVARFSDRAGSSLQRTLSSQLRPGPSWIPGGPGRRVMR